MKRHLFICPTVHITRNEFLTFIHSNNIREKMLYSHSTLDCRMTGLDIQYISVSMINDHTRGGRFDKIFVSHNCDLETDEIHNLLAATHDHKSVFIEGELYEK